MAYIQGCQTIILLKYCIFVKIFYLNSVDPAEKLHYAAPHSGILPFVKLPAHGVSCICNLFIYTFFIIVIAWLVRLYVDYLAYRWTNMV